MNNTKLTEDCSFLELHNLDRLETVELSANGSFVSLTANTRSREEERKKEKKIKEVCLWDQATGIVSVYLISCGDCHSQT